MTGRIVSENRGKKPDEIANALAQAGYEQGSADNMSVIVTPITPGDNTPKYAAVFDGHAGMQVSEHLYQHFGQQLTHQLNVQLDIAEKNKQAATQQAAPPLTDHEKKIELLGQLSEVQMKFGDLEGVVKAKGQTSKQLLDKFIEDKNKIVADATKEGKKLDVSVLAPLVRDLNVLYEQAQAELIGLTSVSKTMVEPLMPEFPAAPKSKPPVTGKDKKPNLHDHLDQLAKAKAAERAQKEGMISSAKPPVKSKPQPATQQEAFSDLLNKVKGCVYEQSEYNDGIKDAYDVLGIPEKDKKNVSNAQIDKAYEEKDKQCSPKDKDGLKAVYEVLRNKENREKYDVTIEGERRANSIRRY